MTAARNPSVYSDAGDRWRLVEADALLMLARLPDASVDCVVTDPPYAIGFHGEDWDAAAIGKAVSAEGERLSPGEAFARWTQIWAVEAGRVLKPGGYLLAFGAPRTFHRLVAGVEDAGLEVRDQLLWLFNQGMPKSRRLPGGRGTALKPSYEPVLLAKAPLRGRVADNIERFGTGALNIEATQIPAANGAQYWPANLAISHTTACQPGSCSQGCPVSLLEEPEPGRHLSRMLFCPKAPRSERDAGCGQLPRRSAPIFANPSRPPRLVANSHPTVKPLELMRWLVRLAAPPGGTVLDPFAGSGSTGAAALLEGRRFLGLEREAAYVDIACARLTHWAATAAQEEALP